MFFFTTKMGIIKKKKRKRGRETPAWRGKEGGMYGVGRKFNDSRGDKRG